MNFVILFKKKLACKVGLSCQAVSCPIAEAAGKGRSLALHHTCWPAKSVGLSLRMGVPHGILADVQCSDLFRALKRKSSSTVCLCFGGCSGVFK